MKKILAVLLTVTMLFSLCVAFGSNAFRQGGTATAIKGTPTVDGVKDAAWDNAPAYRLSNIITNDTVFVKEPANADPAGAYSSDVRFRVMWDNDYLYMLFEISDNEISVDNATDYWTDSIFLYISEDGVNTAYNENAYQICAKLDNSALYVRNNKGTNANVASDGKHATVIAGNAESGFTAVMEIGFKFNTAANLKKDGAIGLDLQYNDADPSKTTAGSGNVRTVTWQWCANNTGPNDNKGNWGLAYLRDTSTTEQYFEIHSEWYYKTATADPDAAGAGWNTASGAYKTWTKGKAPFGNRAYGALNTWGTSDAVEGTEAGDQANAYLWAVKEFEVEDAEALAGAALMTKIFYDDTINIYINGICVFRDNDSSPWNDAYDFKKLTVDASDYLKTGTNIIAVSLQQHTGGYEFDMMLYATSDPCTGLFPQGYLEIPTADALIHYINAFNAGSFVTTSDKNPTITADLDFTGKTWTPITKDFCGLIEGNGHTLSGIVYKTDAATGNIGLIANKLGNQNSIKGTVQNLTIKDSVIVAPATDGTVGAFAGFADRGRVINCTADNVTVIGNGTVGGIVGLVSWPSEDTTTLIKDCTVKNCTLKASDLTGGIIGKSTDTVADLGNATVINNKIAATAVFNPFVAEASAEATKDAASTATGNTENFTAEVTEGASLSFTGSETTLTIATSANINAATSILVDGSAIPAARYSVVNGKLVIKKAYLNTLSIGGHTVSIESPLGNTSATITVTNDPPAPPVPPTGDIAAVAVALALLSLAAAYAVTKKRKSTVK